MRPKITLILCIHNHQPVGSHDPVLKEAFEKCYEPFVNCLERHPGVKLTLHYSGPLLQWMPESFTNSIRSLVRNGQVELLTSGFYEPVLPIIPFKDALDQLSAYTNFLKEKFGRRPEGFWLAEKTWEPNIPQLAAESGLRYTFVDNSHFLHAGLKEEELTGYYVTEYVGAILSIFPISERLRYLIPSEKPQEMIKHLSSYPDGSILVYADAGEKFGCRPKDNKLVRREEWLEQLLSLIEKNDWITLKHPSTVLSQTYPKGRIYLPTASHDEKGSYFRSLFVKHPEANQIHKKMLYVSKKVRAMREKGKARAKRELWQGQGDCADRHGIFGGLSLPHLREALYSHLIAAEVIADKETRGRKFLHFAEQDFDCDGHKEFLIETPLLNLYVHPLGGKIFEFDYRPSQLNLLNTLARPEELPHTRLNSSTRTRREDSADDEPSQSIPDELKDHLARDRTTRDCLIDHLLVPETTSQQFAQMAYTEVESLSDFPYSSRLKKSDSDITLELSRKWNNSIVTKTITLDTGEAAVSILYHIRLATPSAFLFGTEFNLNLCKPIPPKDPSGEIHVVDEKKRIAFSLRFDNPAEIWVHPIETLSQSQSRCESIYQGFCLMPVWKITAGEFTTRMRLEVSTC